MSTEKILDFFFHMDFFEDKKLISKRFYLLYTLIGGIYYESYVRQWFRYCTKTYLIVSIIFTVTNCLITLHQVGTRNLTVTLYSITTSYGMLTTLLNVLICYYWRESLRSFIESINKYSGMYENYNVEKYFKFRYAFLLILFSLFNSFSRFITFCLTMKDSSEVDPLYNYLYPLAFPKEVSWLEYILLSFLISLFLMPLSISFFVSVIIISLTSIYLKNIAISLTTEMKLASNYISKSLDISYEHEMTALEAQTSMQHKYEEFRNIGETRKLCYEKLESYVREWIQRHQKLILEMNLINGFLTGVSSLWLMGITISLLTISYGAIMTVGGKSFELSSLIPCHMFFLLILCTDGHLYGSMTDDLEKQIYEIPWYYLLPRQRRLVLNFLTVVQKSLVLKAFKLYPIMLGLYPRILIKVSSYLQIMKIVEQKVQI